VTRNLTRALLVAVAVAVGAWLVFSLRVVDLQASGEATLKRAEHGRISAAELAGGLDDLRRADRHNPDLTPLLDQGWLLYAAGRRQDALVIGLKAASKEPENVQPWILVYLTAPNPHAAIPAAAKVRQLNPWLGDSLRQ
jgi:hypothetical protein